MNELIDELLTDEDYLIIVKPFLQNEEFKKRIKYQHFNNISMYEHALHNSYLDYLYAKKYGFNNSEIVSASIAGLLHNFYPNDKQLCKPKPIEAVLNSIKYFGDVITPNIADAIESHKFPYAISKIPNDKVSLLVNHVDSLVKAKNTSSMDNIEKHISIVDNSIPISFHQMHELFYDFLDEYDICIDRRVLPTIVSFELRRAFFNYLVRLYPDVDKTLLGESVINTVKREELLSKMNFVLDNIKEYDSKELKMNLNVKRKTIGQK